MSTCSPIELFEYTSVEVSRDRLPLEAAALLKQMYSEKLTVETTSFMTDSNWKLTSQGWVGYIPLMGTIS
jgi:5-methylcytosine-specific restriction enzyme subunit McrC